MDLSQIGLASCLTVVLPMVDHRLTACHQDFPCGAKAPLAGRRPLLTEWERPLRVGTANLESVSGSHSTSPERCWPHVDSGNVNIPADSVLWRRRSLVAQESQWNQDRELGVHW